MKAVILARVSSKEQEEGYSLDAQTIKLREYCQKQNLDIVKEYTIVESSTNGKRTEFIKMLNECEEYKEKIVIVCDKVDRLHRNFNYLERLKNDIMKEKIEIHTIGDGCIMTKDSNHHSWLIFNLMTLLAQNYTDAISYNVKRSVKRKLELGEWSSAAPLGYRNIRDSFGKAHIILDEERAPLILKFFETYATGQYNVNQMVKFVNDWGLRTKKGNILTKQALHKMLRNPFYYGIMATNKQNIPHIYPILVPKEVWKQAEQVRIGKGKHTRHKEKIPFLYRGMLTCSNSGRLISTETHKNHNYLGYRNKENKLSYIREEKITLQISKILNELKFKEEHRDYLANILKLSKEEESNFTKEEMDKIQSNLNQTLKRINSLADLYIDKKIDQDIYETKMSMLKIEKAELLEELKKYNDATDSYTDKIADIVTAVNGYGQEFLYFTENLHKIIDPKVKSSKIEFIQGFLKSVFRTLEIKNGKLGYTLHEPFILIKKLASCQNWWVIQDSNL